MHSYHPYTKACLGHGFFIYVKKAYVHIYVCTIQCISRVDVWIIASDYGSVIFIPFLIEEHYFMLFDVVRFYVHNVIIIKLKTEKNKKKKY